MKTIIYKYPLKIAEVQQIELPAGAMILSVQMQNGTPCMWARINPEAEKKTVKVRMYGTGEVIDGLLLLHIGTVQDGQLVWHYFIESEPVKPGGIRTSPLNK